MDTNQVTHISDIPKHPLDILVIESVKNIVTDIHLRVNRPLKIRKAGGLIEERTEAWEGELLSEDIFISMLNTLKLDPGRVGYALRRYSGINAKVQVRATYFPNFDGDALILRIQNLHPESFSSMIPDAGIASDIRSAHGLILLTGAIGSGKTTLAASIAELWAKDARHVMTLEDPVEYVLRSDEGNVTQINCNLIPSELSVPDRNLFAFNDALSLALRSDIEGLMIGECRTSDTFRYVLEIASAREPVVTTLHAGGIADAIIKMVTMATDKYGPDVARTTLAQTIHSVFDVRMGYTKEGRPCPMIALLPFFKHDRLKKLITDFDANKIKDYIKEEMEEGKLDEGFINYETASHFAKDRGAIKFESRY